MPATLLGLQILLILLPGFASAYIVRSLTSKRLQSNQASARSRAKSDLEQAIEALVFSLPIYIVFVVFNHGNIPFSIQHDPTGKLDDILVWHPHELLLLTLLTILFSFFAICYIRFDGNRFFRLLKLTERTTHNSIWNDVFENEATRDQVVQVELGDKRSVMGVLLYYSDTAEDCSLFLKQASWVEADSTLTPIPGQGILLNKSSDIRSVSLLSPPENPHSETAATDGQ